MKIDLLNKKSSHAQYIAGLDIGTSKIAMVIGEFTAEGECQILGAGISPSKGLKQGVVVNIDDAIESIRKAVLEAQLTAGLEIKDVVIGIAGDHVKSINSRGVVAVSRPDREIQESDVKRVIDAARAIDWPNTQEVLHVLPQDFIVDSRKGIKNPLGLNGVRLEAEVHIVTASKSATQSLVRCVNKAGLNVIDQILEPLASAEAVLSDSDKNLGVALVDLGGSTADMAIFYEGTVRHTAVIGLGSQNVTNDIAIGLRISLEQAEDIKRRYGCTHPGLIAEDAYFIANGIDGRSETEVSMEMLCEIIQPRVEEILGHIGKEIKQSKSADKITAGVVLTGGGAMLKGIRELAREVLGVPVKIGVPSQICGLVESVASPEFSTGVGLVKLCSAAPYQSGPGISGLKDVFQNMMNSIVKLYKEWF
jgi:cell division protein FtsA